MTSKQPPGIATWMLKHFGSGSIAAGVMWMPALGVHFFNREGPSSTPSSFIWVIALPLIVGTMCGWLVARWQISVERNPFTIRIPRVHPDRKTGVVLLFAASIFLVNLLFFGAFVLRFGPRLTYIFAPLLATDVAASVLGILFGGGLFRNKSRLARARP